jgi:hypothetical protein
VREQTLYGAARFGSDGMNNMLGPIQSDALSLGGSISLLYRIYMRYIFLIYPAFRFQLGNVYKYCVMVFYISAILNILQ